MADKTLRWAYRTYGLRLQVNRQIPGLVPLLDPKPADVSIELSGPRSSGMSPRPRALLYASPGRTETGERFFEVWRDDQHDEAYLYLRYASGKGHAEFTINLCGSEVRAVWTEGIAFDDVVAYLLGPVLGCVLRLRGITCLHAGVVAIGSAAIAIIGPKGAGKSAAVAGLARRGHAVLTDDIAPLVEEDGRFIVQPGYPRLRLWPATIDTLHGLNAGQLPRVLSIADKRYLDLMLDRDALQWRFQQEPLPLAAVYVLGAWNSDGILSITPIPAAAGLINLVGNVYADYALNRTGRARDFWMLGRLAASIPLRQVHRPDRIDDLPRVCQAILDDLRTLTNRGSSRQSIV